jgi:transposase
VGDQDAFFRACDTGQVLSEELLLPLGEQPGGRGIGAVALAACTTRATSREAASRLPSCQPGNDLPPRSAACCYFAKWRDDGTGQAVHDLLRRHAREKKGRRADPALVVLDTQSVHSAASVPAGTTGRDAAKKVPGRKRCLAVDGPGAGHRGRGPGRVGAR